MCVLLTRTEDILSKTDIPCGTSRVSIMGSDLGAVFVMLGLLIGPGSFELSIFALRDRSHIT